MRISRRSLPTPLLVSFALIACDEAPPIDPEPVPEFAAISAVVTNDGDPIAGAGVRVTALASPVGFSRRTAPNGTARIDSIPPGDYKVNVSAPSGYTGSGTDTLTLEAGNDITLSYSLEEDDGGQDPYGTFVVGVFVDSVIPYEGAVIHIEAGGLPDGGHDRDGTTNAQGLVHFIDVTPDTYTALLIVPSGYEVIPPGDNTIQITVQRERITEIRFHIREVAAVGD